MLASVSWPESILEMAMTSAVEECKITKPPQVPQPDGPPAHTIAAPDFRRRLPMAWPWRDPDIIGLACFPANSSLPLSHAKR